MKKKISLNSISVKSFITEVDNNKKQTIVGGATLARVNCTVDPKNLWSDPVFNSMCNMCIPRSEANDCLTRPDIQIG